MKIVLASNNEHKLKELEALCQSLPIEIVPQRHFHVPKTNETGLTFVENAILKARQACRYSHLPAIADDSGLEVDALQGKPGIHSARFANAKLGTTDYCHRLLQQLSLIPSDRWTARYRCVLVFLKHEKDPSPILGEGVLEGIIIDKAQGNNGFGYDPIFYLPDRKCTVAELSFEEKNQISHRHRAITALIKRLRTTQMI